MSATHIPTEAESAPEPLVVTELDPAHVAQRPDNLRDANRGITELT